jgi:hypothetical protein
MKRADLYVSILSDGRYHLTFFPAGPSSETYISFTMREWMMVVRAINLLQPDYVELRNLIPRVQQ